MEPLGISSHFYFQVSTIGHADRTHLFDEPFKKKK